MNILQEKIFGTKYEGVEYPLREGAYALPCYFDEVKQEIMIVIARVFLPHDSKPRHQLIGGAMEEEDFGDPLSTLHREVREETGYEVRQVEYLGPVKEYVNGRIMKFDKRAHCYGVELGEKKYEAVEANHTLVHVTVEEALELIPHESSLYAIRTYYHHLINKKITPPGQGELS